MQKPKSPFVVAAGLSIFAIAAACLFYVTFRHGQTAHASSAPDLLSALPAGAPSLIYIDLAAIRASSFYQHRPDKGPIAVPDKNYAEFVQSTGFDFEKDLDRVAIATWPATTGKDPAPRKIVVIADGRFDRAKIRDYAMKKGKVDHQQGHEVFQFSNDDKLGSSSLTFLDDHRVAIVEGPSIASVLASHGANSTSDPDPALERAARLDGAAVFLVSRMPPMPDNFAPGGVQSAQLASLVRSVQWITLAAAPDGDNLRISLEGECATSTDARQLQAALEVLRLFGRAALESPKTKQSMNPATFAGLETLLSTAQVTAAAERTRILIELTPDILKWGGAQKAQ